ncbi:MAG: YheC/YheD family protein [Myxococcota bacterium]|nr:YheC/YheD family protein [Myxococcota bacterium]
MDSQVIILVPTLSDAPPAPENTPLGRAALALAQEGIEAAFGAGAHRWKAQPGRWSPVESTGAIAVHDRFPSQSRPDEYASARTLVSHLPMGNPTSLTELCRDKLACQQHLESHGIVLPELEADPTRFADRLSTWGAAFLKPRYGGLGRGVKRVVPGDALPAWGEGAVPGVEEPLFLQRAITPPSESAGLAMRWLIQALPNGDWLPRTPIARVSHNDPVVNVARGAHAVAAQDILDETTLRTALELCLRSAQALRQIPNGEWLLEIGVDMVIDEHQHPHVIEINSRPQGRLEHLAQRSPDWMAEHVEACAQPIRTLAALAHQVR